MDSLHELEYAVAVATDTAARVRAMNAFSNELVRAGQAKRAIGLAREAREWVESLGDPQLDAETRHVLARCHFYLADFVVALELLLQTATQYQACGDLAGAATALAGVGLCQHRLGANEDAVASLLRALDSARSFKLEALEINIHNSLGSALIWAGRTTEAAGHLATGIELAQTAGNRSLLTKLLMNQSLLAKRSGDAACSGDPATAQAEYTRALEQVTSALELARECGNVYDQAHCLGQSGCVLRLLGRHAQAGQMLQQTLELGQTLNESHLQAEALMELGRLRVAEERPDLARQLLTEAIALARRIAARSVLAEACEALSQVAEATGDVTTALAMYKEFHAVRESELADSRKHAALAAQLGLDFQEASRRAAEYRERAEALAADHAALTTRARALAEVSEQDPLTGLLNRRGLETRIGSLLIAGDAQNAPLTMALIDIDIFKRINDSHSHAVGDAVLKQVAGVIRAHCRQNDLPVRYGGDEFLLVLADANLSTGAKVLQRLKVANDSWPWQDLSPGLAVTLSIGAAERAPGASITAAIEAADAALYEAKNAGRNQIATRGSESAAAAVFGPTEPR